MHVAYFPALIRAGRIEITQAYVPKAICPTVGFQRMLKDELGESVRVYRCSSVVFDDQRLGRKAVHGASRRKDDVANGI